MFERLKNKYVGRHDWPIASASKCSSEYLAGSRGDSDGYYDVVYSFWIDGHIYEGQYISRYDLEKDETIDVRYNPKDPNINFNPDYDFLYKNGLTPVLLSAGLVVAVVAIVLFLKR